MESGEGLQEAAARELKEETGIDIPAEQMIPFGVLSITPINQIYFTFHYNCETLLTANITREVSDWGWYTESDAPWSEMAYIESHDYVLQTYEWLRNNDFSLRIGKKIGIRWRCRHSAHLNREFRANLGYSKIARTILTLYRKINILKHIHQRHSSQYIAFNFYLSCHNSKLRINLFIQHI